MSRRQTPDDIMANLMNGSTCFIDGKQENHKAINKDDLEEQPCKEGVSQSREHESHRTIKLSKNKAIKQDGDMEIFETKEKATFNLSLSTLRKLEDSWIKLKRQLKGEQRVTKTAIVEMALEICIDDLSRKDTESSLYKWLAEPRTNEKLNDNSPS